MPHIYLETDRFIVRQWELTDVDELLKIMSDSKVHTYTGDSAWSRERTENYIRLMLDKNFNSLDMFHGACILKESDQLIGFTGLNPYIEKQPELEWQLGTMYWGNGYATEVGEAVIKKAFKTTDIEYIFGMANPNNRASMRVLEKIGMVCLVLMEFRGHQDMFYQIYRPE